MKTNLLLALICLLAYSCGPNAEQRSEYSKMDSLNAAGSPSQVMKESSPSVSSDQTGIEKTKMDTKTILPGEENKKGATFSLSQNLENLSDTIYLQNVRLSKKFIKTADLRFKVKNVEQTTHKIETLAEKLNGYVYQSDIKSNRMSEQTIELSPDTMKLVFEYYIDNSLIIKVPHIYFDSVMNEIAKMHIYLDYRNIKTKDISTIFLRNKLKAEKNSEYEKRIQKASDQGNRRLDDIVEAERQASEMADKAIDKKIDNYQLQDSIDFSTITMNIYQSNSVHEEMVKNTRLKEYQPNFWQRAWAGFKTGWGVILDIIVALVYLWPLYLLAILVFFMIKYYTKRFMKK
jgi:hypothetical protein